MAEGKRKAFGSATGANPPPPSPPSSPSRIPHHRRRLLSPPANDNATGPGSRALRAAVFVAIGAVLAFLMHYVMG